MGYKFRLEPILKLNTMDVNKSSNELKEKERFYKIETAELERLTRELNNIGNRTGADAFTLRNEMLYKDNLRERIEAQVENVNSASKKVNLANSALIKAQVKKKSIEKLKDREIEDYKANLAHKERLELDEFATMRYNYKSIFGE